MKDFFFKISILLLFACILSMETVSAYKCPNYVFQKNLVKGSVSEDVRAIQEILNLDKRTVVAYSGLGSKGNETALYGVATRESMKRFQALFIEYIGVADGKFNDKTRAVMNNVCKGPFFTGGGTSVYDFATSTIKDTLPPIIGVAAISTTTIDTPFRAYLASSEAIKTPNLSGLIITGGTAGDVRKTSSTTYTFLVTPNLDARGAITLQFEADSISDLAGNKNPVASNEWTTYIIQVSSVGDATTTFPELDFPSITTSPAVDCSTVSSVSVYDYSNPCYGRAPTTPTSDSGQQSSDSGGGSQIMQMLQGLLKGLTGLGGGGGGGGQAAGGKAVASAPCMCQPLLGQPTVILAGLKGPSGGALSMPCPGQGDYTGFTMPPPPVCGLRIDTKTGQCIGPNLNGAGVPIVATIGTCPSTWMWNN